MIERLASLWLAARRLRTFAGFVGRKVGRRRISIARAWAMAIYCEK